MIQSSFRFLRRLYHEKRIRIFQSFLCIIHLDKPALSGLSLRSENIPRMGISYPLRIGFFVRSYLNPMRRIDKGRLWPAQDKTNNVWKHCVYIDTLFRVLSTFFHIIFNRRTSLKYMIWKSYYLTVEDYMNAPQRE